MDDEGRLAALARLQVLETAPEEPFEKVVNLVRIVLAVPIATVTLVDRDRQWFKARRGIEVTETPRSISFCAHTIQQLDPLIVHDAYLDARFAANPLVLGAPGIRSYAGVPLRTPEGYNVGSLCAMDTKPRQFSPADIAILSNFANIVSDELELRTIARSDHLTGALTRRGFEEQAQRELARHVRYGRPSSLLILDIDHFKAVNDTYGHPAGDQVLRQVAAVCEATLRPADVLGRLGGEEFAILLPETEAADASSAAERVRDAIQNHEFAIPGGAVLKVTASFGGAPIAGCNAISEWLAAADQELYRAKDQGRNCTRMTTMQPAN